MDCGGRDGSGNGGRGNGGSGDRIDHRAGCEQRRQYQRRLRRIGVVHLPDPVGASLDVWSLAQYGGGLFVPLRDATAGSPVELAGSYLGGAAMKDAILSGFAAAERLAAGPAGATR